MILFVLDLIGWRGRCTTITISYIVVVGHLIELNEIMIEIIENRQIFTCKDVRETTKVR